MKHFMKRAACILIALLLIGAYAIPAAATSANPASEARDGVVRVAWYSDEDEYWGHGTGFIIGHSGGNTYIVTNRHVVKFYLESNIGDMYIITEDIFGPKIKCEVQLLTGTYGNRVYDNIDLAILTAGVGLGNRLALPLAPADTVDVADTVYALGFPAVADVIDGSERLSSTVDDVTVTRGTISRNVATYLDTDVYQTDTFINSGNSGGPLINESGAVIGVNTWGVDGESVNYAIHIDYIISICDQWGIEYTLYDGSSTIVDTPAEVEPPAEAEAPVETQAPAAVTETPVPSANEGGLNIASYWWVLLIVVGVVAAVVLVVMLGKKKSAPSSAASATSKTVAQVPSAPSAAASAQVSGGPSKLLCTKGHFSGSSFPLKGTLAIGRDPKRCQIVFPNDTKGISSVHCEVMIHGGDTLLTDKGSSYGTFMAGGKKLTANEGVTLKAGDSFYLADGENEFTIL